jgi:catechol 2,3-dioxygenase-like lactoylglutathione lyase family enzyme
MEVEVIGIDHIYLAVSDMARAREFYDRLMPILGFKPNSFENEGDLHVQYYNRHFGIVLRPARQPVSKHDPLAPGLHHLCLRVHDRVAVGECAHRVGQAGIECSAPQLYPEYAPDYYAIFFSDPDGIRWEITNFREERQKRFRDWPDC